MKLANSLKSNNVPRMIQNKYILTGNVIEFIFKTYSQRKLQTQMALMVNFLLSRKDAIPILPRLPQKMKEGGHFPSHLWKKIIRKVNYIPHEYRCKNAELNISNSNQAIHKRKIHYYQMVIILRMQERFYIKNQSV